MTGRLDVRGLILLACSLLPVGTSSAASVGIGAFAGDTFESFEGIAGPLAFPNFGVTGIRGPTPAGFMTGTGLSITAAQSYINDWAFGQANISSTGVSITSAGDVIDGTAYFFVYTGAVSITLPHAATRWGAHMGGNGVQGKTFNMYMGATLVDSFTTGPGVTDFTVFTGWQSTAMFDRIEWAGGHSGFDQFAYDDAIPAPTCTLAAPAGVSTGDVALDLDAASVSAGAVDVTFEFSIDGGATFSPCTASAASALGNPATAVPVGLSVFLWDSSADGVGAVVVQPGVIARATVDDGVASSTGQCDSLPFDVDNSALCQGICGDCNLSATGPDILDALAAAQISAGLSTPMGMQIGCCDVDSSGGIAILDALLIAQSAAGLVVSIACP